MRDLCTAHSTHSGGVAVEFLPAGDCVAYIALFFQHQKLLFCGMSKDLVSKLREAEAPSMPL